MIRLRMNIPIIPYQIRCLRYKKKFQFCQQMVSFNFELEMESRFNESAGLYKGKLLWMASHQFYENVELIDFLVQSTAAARYSNSCLAITYVSLFIYIAMVGRVLGIHRYTSSILFGFGIILHCHWGSKLLGSCEKSIQLTEGFMSTLRD